METICNLSKSVIKFYFVMLKIHDAFVDLQSFYILLRMNSTVIWYKTCSVKKPLFSNTKGIITFKFPW